VRNGADFVIEQLACGLSISPRAFAEFGVGGLLKDTQARGLPRPKRSGE
jgi:molybdenum cofactor cytidylyltransferase